jgi:hypothetical protein
MDLKKIISQITKYRFSIFPGFWLLELLTLSYVVLKDLNPIITTIIGLLFSVPVSLFWLEYNVPILQIKNKIEYVKLDWNKFQIIKEKLAQQFGMEYDAYANISDITYKCARIFIENTGRSAAKDCKGYFVTETGKERICWTIPTERPNATINVEDYERLDFCAFPLGIEDDRIIVPHENGWESPSITGPLKKCKVLVTSENAEPVEANIIMDTDRQEIIIE